MKKLVFLAVLLLNLFASIEAFSCHCSGNYEFNTQEDLAGYDFVALVQIDSIYASAIPKTHENDLFYQADLTVLESFKGDSPGIILIHGGNKTVTERWSSCDMGIDKSETWLIFARREENGQLKTRFCTFSSMYADSSGEKTTHGRSVSDLEKLRSLFQAAHP